MVRVLWSLNIGKPKAPWSILLEITLVEYAVLNSYTLFLARLIVLLASLLVFADNIALIRAFTSPAGTLNVAACDEGIKKLADNNK
ncbi:MAG: hypothetical protein OHK0057_13810 [Thermoflexibacter sp.]